MVEIFALVKDWFFGLGTQYGVDPIIFGSIYVGAIPLFMLSLTWLLKNYRSNKSVLMPVLSVIACYISSYVYLIIVGKNVPWWVFSIIVLIVLHGTWSTYWIIRKKMGKIDERIIADEQL